MNSTVIDVGANTGLYTYILTEYGNNYQVIGFEPLPVLSKRLKVLFKNKARIFQTALSDCNKIVSMKIPFINNIIYRTRATINKNVEEIEETKSEFIEVQSQTLDDFIKINNITRLHL